MSMEILQPPSYYSVQELESDGTVVHKEIFKDRKEAEEAYERYVPQHDNKKDAFVHYVC